MTAKIEKDVRSILADPEFQKAQLASIAFSVPSDSNARGFAEPIRQDFEAKKKLVGAA